MTIIRTVVRKEPKIRVAVKDREPPILDLPFPDRILYEIQLKTDVIETKKAC